MNLLDTYKAKKLGAITSSLFSSYLAKRMDASVVTITESYPYVKRLTANGEFVKKACEDTIVGGTLAWNQLVGSIDTSVTIPSGHVYYANIGGIKSIGKSNGSAILVNGITDNVIDITLLFGIYIASYIYTLETNHAGDGLSYFIKLFPEDYYEAHSVSLESVNVSAHINRDVHGSILGNYALDESLILRGIPKLDSNNKLYYDGDTYESDGKVTRKYKLVDLGSLSWNTTADANVFRSWVADKKNGGSNFIADGFVYGGTNDILSIPDRTYCGVSNSPNVYFKWTEYSSTSSFKEAIKGTYMLYELATPVTEYAEPFSNPQLITSYGTEEYVDYSVEQGNRDVSIPVGHNTKYKKYI